MVRDHHADAAVGQFDHRADRVERQPHEVRRVVAVEDPVFGGQENLGQRGPSVPRRAMRARFVERGVDVGDGEQSPERGDGGSAKPRRVAGPVGALVVCGDRGGERCHRRETAQDQLRPGLRVRIDHAPLGRRQFTGPREDCHRDRRHSAIDEERSEHRE